jgi:hypothetical protein
MVPPEQSITISTGRRPAEKPPAPESDFQVCAFACDGSDAEFGELDARDSIWAGAAGNAKTSTQVDVQERQFGGSSRLTGVLSFEE